MKDVTEARRARADMRSTCPVARDMERYATLMNPDEPTPVLSICVPVYNEAENLPLLHEAIVKVVEPIGLATEIILVDDASKDGSWEQIRALVEKDPRVRGVKFLANCGETAASDAGMRAA